jgi:threonine dehydratase
MELPAVLNQRLVDDYCVVTEDEITTSLCEFMSVQQMLIEGSAAVAIASFLQQQERFVGKNVVIVLCGANISLATLKEILC